MWFWAVSSVVRALASHARGHWFKSSTAHHRKEMKKWHPVMVAEAAYLALVVF